MEIFKSRKYTVESLKELAKNQNWTFLSEEYKGGSVKHDFLCENGHKIQKTIEHFLKGSGCPVCSGKSKLTIEILRAEASLNDWELLTSNYSGKTEIMQFKCLKCLRQFPLLSSHLRGNKRTKNCPFCSPLRKKTIDEIKNDALKLGFKCLSNEYINISKKLLWKCKYEHKWIATPNDIFNNHSGCPECRYWKNEAKIKFIFENYFGKLFHKKSKLKTLSGTFIELDGYNSELNLAFEYNGIQHYEFIPYFHKNNISNFESQKFRDELKLKYCKDENIDLIVIPYSIVKDDELAVFILSNLPQKYKKDIEEMKTIINSYGNDSDMLKPIREKLESIGLELISNVYTSSSDKNIIIRCKTCNHKYSSTKIRIDKMILCPKCAGVMAFTIFELNKIASENNIKLLSTEYKPSEKVMWECSKGHKWSALPSTIKGTKLKKGTNCPVCFGKKTTTIEDAKKLAISRGHKCLSLKIKNRSSKLLWECKKIKGEIHIWESSFQSYNNSKNGCRFCSGKEKYVII